MNRLAGGIVAFANRAEMLPHSIEKIAAGKETKESAI